MLSRTRPQMHRRMCTLKIRCHSLQESNGSRYFEHQQPGPHCGLQALNNLCRSPPFLPRDLQRACDSVLVELGSEVVFFEDRRLHTLPNGYSHGVLAMAFDLLLPPTWKMLSVAARGSDWSRFWHICNCWMFGEFAQYSLGKHSGS